MSKTIIIQVIKIHKRRKYFLFWKKKFTMYVIILVISKGHFNTIFAIFNWKGILSTFSQYLLKKIGFKPNFIALHSIFHIQSKDYQLPSFQLIIVSYLTIFRFILWVMVWPQGYASISNFRFWLLARNVWFWLILSTS